MIYNIKPLCDKPQDGCMTKTHGALLVRLCGNPVHRDEPEYHRVGPVWHPDWTREK